jgi:hypothetical protein
MALERGIALELHKSGEQDGTGKESHLVDGKDPDLLF